MTIHLSAAAGLSEVVAARAAEWFPDGKASETVHIRELSSRPTCSLYAVSLGGVGSAPQILAKIRRAVPTDTPPGAPAGARPRLRSEPLTPQELTALEYDGLSAILSLFGRSDPRFGAIRPLAHLPDEATILMDYVDLSTLRQKLIADSRLVPHGNSARRPDPSAGVWRNAGSWLRALQESTTLPVKPTRQGTRREIVEHFHAYHEFLTARLGPQAFGDVAERGAALAAEVFPEQLPLAIGHGDYAPRNMFVGADGRLTVFDPLPRWTVPKFEDLCRFLAGTRLLGLQVHTQGVAFSRHQLETYEREVISGYLDGTAGPVAQIRCYQLFIMLDKWSALVEGASRGRDWRQRLQRSSLALANRYLHTEAHRLLELARSGAH